MENNKYFPENSQTSDLVNYLSLFLPLKSYLLQNKIPKEHILSR